MTYDRAAIMTAAWTETRYLVERVGYSRHQVRALFRNALARAWWAAKEAARLAALSVAELRMAVTVCENTERLGFEGLKRLATLQSALAAAVAREAAEKAAADLAAKRALIASAGGRFCTVIFTKADGTERTMKVQPAALKFHVKGEAATEAGKKAAATRAERHPHLLPVWDAETRAPRSVNLATIREIRVNGATHDFRAA